MSLLVLLAALAVCSGTVFAGRLNTYTTKYDSLDVDEILSNDRLYRKYFLCLTGEGKCSAEGKELRDHLPEALASGCEKCTPKQREGSEKVLRHLMEKRPEDWVKLEKIFDPMGDYRRRYGDQILLKGIRLEVETTAQTMENTDQTPNPQ